MNRLRIVLTLMLGLCAALLAAPASAQLCTASASAAAFGAYATSNPTATDSTGVVTVTCSAAVSLLVGYTIGIGGGSYGTVSQRYLGSGASRLGYQFYNDAARSAVWGDVTGTVSDGYLLQLLVPVVRNYTVYARIPAGQNVMPGAYTDTINVSLTY